MSLAIGYGGSWLDWLEDPRALVTAIEVVEEMNREMRAPLMAGAATLAIKIVADASKATSGIERGGRHRQNDRVATWRDGRRPRWSPRRGGGGRIR